MGISFDEIKKIKVGEKVRQILEQLDEDISDLQDQIEVINFDDEHDVYAVKSLAAFHFVEINDKLNDILFIITCLKDNN